MATMALLASMTLISTPRLAKLLLIVGVPLVAAVGVVLVYSWWHYPSDVVAGWCLAVSWVAALCFAIRPKRAQSVKSGDSASRSPYSTRGA
jgi:membrane-associated phospholipid phosphatase